MENFFSSVAYVQGNVFHIDLSKYQTDPNDPFITLKRICKTQIFWLNHKHKTAPR